MKTVALFFLGGTIAMRDGAGGACPSSDPRSGDPKSLLDRLDFGRSAVRLLPEVLMNVPSGHLTMSDLYALTRRIAWAGKGGADGIVVIQGTDTIEETAFALDLMYAGTAPIVVTGAMRTATAVSPDGPGNIRDAVLTALDRGTSDRGVVAVLNGAIHAAASATKSHTVRLDSFVSRDAGPMGLIVENRVEWHCGRTPRSFTRPPAKSFARVVLLKSHLGDDGFAVKALGKARIDGLVFEGLGGGHASPDAADRLEVLAAGIPVILATRCSGGPVLTRSYGYVGGDMDLIGRGLIPCGLLSGPKARVALNILLDSRKSVSHIKRFFGRY